MAVLRERDPFNIPVALREMEIFRGLSGEGLFSVASDMQERVFDPGEIIVEEGSTGEHLYVVGTGAAEVVKGLGSASETSLATLGPGDFFGEMSLIENETRSASVRAAVPETTVFALGRSHLARLARERPAEHHLVVVNIARVLSHRLRRLGDAYTELRREVPAVAAAAPATLGWEGVFIFEGLDRAALCALAVASNEIILSAGQTAFEEGQFGDSVWIVGDGSVEVVKSAGKPGQTVLAGLGPGTVFGEMCLVEGGLRSATVRARETSLLHCLTNATLHKFAQYWPGEHTRIIFNIARELSRRLRTLDASVVAAVRGARG